MRDSVSAGTVVVGVHVGKGALAVHDRPHREDRCREQRDTGAGNAKADRRPEEKRQLQRQWRLTRYGAERRQTREHAAEIRRSHEQHTEADRRCFEHTPPRPCPRPARQAVDDADNRGVDRHVGKDVAGKALAPHRPIGLAEEPANRSGIEKPGQARPQDDCQKERRKPARRVETCGRVAQQPHDACRDNRLSAVGAEERQDKAERPARRELDGDVHG